MSQGGLISDQIFLTSSLSPIKCCCQTCFGLSPDVFLSMFFLLRCRCPFPEPSPPPPGLPRPARTTPPAADSCPAGALPAAQGQQHASSQPLPQFQHGTTLRFVTHTQRQLPWNAVDPGTMSVRWKHSHRRTQKQTCVASLASMRHVGCVGDCLWPQAKNIISLKDYR